jgi:hypothetical protein
LAASPAKVIYEEMIMTNKLISMSHVEDRLTAQDDPGVWKEILAALGEEFLQRYRAEQGEKELWFMRIGACSHWVRPHQSRWLAAGEFALPIGYKGAAGVLERMMGGVIPVAPVAVQFSSCRDT